MHTPLLLIKLHMLSGVFITIGAFLLIVWAVKYLNKDKLREKGVWLLVIGIALALLTGGIGGGKFRGKHGYIKDAATHQKVMMEALQGQGVDITEEQLTAAWDELKKQKEGSWKKGRY
jgi:cytochrome bd-type quinol oxidase subunit 1